MSVYKEEKTGTWRVLYRYTDWTGEKKQTQKRGVQDQTRGTGMGTGADESGILKLGYDLSEFCGALP